MHIKTNIGIALILLGAISDLTAQANVTIGTFGYSQVEKPAGTLNFVGDSFGDGGSTLNEIVPIEQYNGSTLLATADRVIVWDPGTQSSATNALFDDTASEGTTVEWRAADDFAGSAVNPVIPAGSGFWVESIGSAVDSNLIVAGNVVSSQSVTNQIVAGLQMLAYPFSVVVDLNATQLKDNATGAAFFADADRVIAWNVATQTYVTYALFDDTAYGGSTIEWRDGNSFTSPPGAIPLGLARGFWVKAKSAFSWVETNPYFNSL